MLPPMPPRMLPPRPMDQHQVQPQQPTLAPSSGGRRKLPEIPRSAKLPHRPHVPHEPHYPSSFHSSFDEDMAPPMSNLPPTVYESYHQQFRQLQRQQSSPMGSNRQLPMAPFGHRRTASSGSFTQPDEIGKRVSDAPLMQCDFYFFWCEEYRQYFYSNDFEMFFVRSWDERKSVVKV